MVFNPLVGQSTFQEDMVKHRKSYAKTMNDAGVARNSGVAVITGGFRDEMLLMVRHKWDPGDCIEIVKIGFDEWRVKGFDRVVFLQFVPKGTKGSHDLGGYTVKTYLDVPLDKDLPKKS